MGTIAFMGLYPDYPGIRIYIKVFNSNMDGLVGVNGGEVAYFYSNALVRYIDSLSIEP